MAVEPANIMAYTSTFGLSGTAFFDIVTLDHTTFSPTSWFTTFWPTTINDNATGYHYTIFPKPTGARLWTPHRSSPTLDQSTAYANVPTRAECTADYLYCSTCS